MSISFLLDSFFYVLKTIFVSIHQIDAKTVSGNTPLHLACLNGYNSMAVALIYFDAPINESNYEGQSPLHISAASTLGGECMKILLKEGLYLIINYYSYGF